ncbi:MAG: hypothetical protein HN916_18060 [Anaerolineae bacterium]|nr:hypothetical protein [Anaerolineae bacterium]
MGGVFLALTAIFYVAVPTRGLLDVDWKIFHHWNFLNPYQPGDPVYSPPWLILLPYLKLPVALGGAINRALMFLVIIWWGLRHRLSLTSIVALLTSPFFFGNLLYNNIDHLILFGLAAQDISAAWALTLKPHLTIGAILFRIKKQPVTFGGILTGLLIVSLLIWHNWPIAAITAILRSTAGGGTAASARNLAIFWWPLSIIPGTIGVWYGIRQDDWAIAALAGLLLSPYLTIANLMILHGITSVRWPKFAWFLWITGWLFTAWMLVR